MPMTHPAPESAKVVETPRIADETERTATVVVNQRSYTVPHDVAKALKIEQLKASASLANNLCPDHRDKQSGKPCLACRIEQLERECEQWAHEAKRITVNLRAIGADVGVPPDRSMQELGDAIVERLATAKRDALEQAAKVADRHINVGAAPDAYACGYADAALNITAAIRAMQAPGAKERTE
jgi:hypothetical protein